MIPLYIIYGYLGSGKTTLIKKLLSRPEFNKAYIIENEFAHINIDEKNLNNNPVIPISGSCICCSTGQELHEALLKIIENNIKKYPVILETTGVANGREVIKKLALDSTFTQNFSLQSVTYVLDALETKSLNTQEIGVADSVYLSKIDLVDIQKVESIKTELKENNLKISDINISSQAIKKLKTTKTISHPEQSYFVVSLKNKIEINKLVDIVKKLYTTQDIYRIKGFFQDETGKYHELQATPNNLEIKPTQVQETLLVFIGQKLDNLKIHDIFQS